MVLILLGIFMAMFIKYGLLDRGLMGKENPFPKFTASMFFNILLPPIILDAAFAIYDREFLSNFSSILTFAIFGTLLNVFAIGKHVWLRDRQTFQLSYRMSKSQTDRQNGRIASPLLFITHPFQGLS